LTWIAETCKIPVFSASLLAKNWTRMTEDGMMRKIEVPKYIQGLIFDCDGTLVDSMPLHIKAWEHAITSMGGVWDPEFFSAKKGMPEESIIALYNEHHTPRFIPQELLAVKHRFFLANAAGFNPIPCVVEIVHAYAGILPMAVASGGIRKNVEMELEAIGIRNYFLEILTADDDIKPKPSPDLFLEAARRLGVAPEYCQVFEDGDLGLEAARKAGMLATDIRCQS
jgi:beta-phosphoglucomutase-like phosphatase (HAD superfamily)